MRTTALGGARWILFGNVAVQGLSIATVAGLARLLEPTDFGLAAVAVVAAGVVTWISEMGLGALIVQRRELEEDVLHTVFWLSSGIGLLLAVAGGVLAAPLTRLLGAPQAASLAVAATAAAAISVVAAVPRALLTRRLQFARRAMVQVVGYSLYSLTALGLAWSTSLGPWSILLGRLVEALVQLTAALLASRYRPAARFGWRFVAGDVPFGVGYLLTHVESYVSKNADYWFVSRIGGTGMLGIYYIAYVLPTLVRQRITWTAEATLLPLLARINDDPARLAKSYREILQFISLLAFPALFGVAVAAQPIVLIGFGEGWSDAARPLAILSVAAALDSLMSPSRSVHLARGQPLRNAGFIALQIGALLPALVVAAARGTLAAFAAAVFAATAVTVGVNLVLTGRYLGIPLRHTGRSLLPATVSTATAVVAVAAVGWVSGGFARLPAPLHIGLVGAIGSSTYLGVGFLFFGAEFRRLTRDIVAMAGQRRRERPGPPAIKVEP